MRLISKIVLGLALALALSGLNACGDDSGPEDLNLGLDFSAVSHPVDMTHATDGGTDTDAAQ